MGAIMSCKGSSQGGRFSRGAVGVVIKNNTSREVMIFGNGAGPFAYIKPSGQAHVQVQCSVYHAYAVAGNGFARFHTFPRSNSPIELDEYLLEKLTAIKAIRMVQASFRERIRRRRDIAARKIQVPCRRFARAHLATRTVATLQIQKAFLSAIRDHIALRHRTASMIQALARGYAVRRMRTCAVCLEDFMKPHFVQMTQYHNSTWKTPPCFHEHCRDCSRMAVDMAKNDGHLHDLQCMRGGCKVRLQARDISRIAGPSKERKKEFH